MAGEGTTDLGLARAMRILVALTYYRPHISGLTTYAQRLAEGLAGRGHHVTVLTSQYDSALPIEEHRHGVRIVRAAVAMRIDKGVLMPGYTRQARALASSHDVVLVNYPMTPLECHALLNAARAAAVPVVAVYHCDLELPGSLWNRAIRTTVEAAGRRLLRAAPRILLLSMDYARTSRLLRPHLDKCVVHAPPVDQWPVDARQAAEFRARHAPGADVVIGVAARIAAEKGIEFLLAAHHALSRELGRVHLLFTGTPRGALGESAYWTSVAPLFHAWGARAKFVGQLPDDEMPAFFAACDVVCLPSVNRTESFGLVQVESLLCGTPVVATDLPGIRDPIARSGMGRLVPPRDTAALTAAVVDVVRHRGDILRPPEQIAAVFGAGTYVHDCEGLLAACAGTGCPAPATADELERQMRLHVSSVPPFRALVRAIESTLIRRHAPTTGPTLDLGCGDGQFASATLPTPVAYGLDPDAAAVDRARRSGVFGRVFCAPADRIPLPDGACGLVLANSVLEHIPSLDRPLAEIHRVLAAGGSLVITAPSHRFAEGFGVAVMLDQVGLRGLARRYRNWFNRLARHHHLDSVEAWQARLESNGFTAVKHEYYLSRSAMFWFDLLHYVSVPSWLAWKCVGRWHWSGRPVFTAAWTSTLLGLARRTPDKEGACVFILARKR